MARILVGSSDTTRRRRFMATKKKPAAKRKPKQAEEPVVTEEGRRVLVPGDALVMQREVSIPSSVIGAPPTVLPAGIMGLVVRCEAKGDCDLVFGFKGRLVTAMGVNDDMLHGVAAVIVWDSVERELIVGEKES